LSIRNGIASAHLAVIVSLRRARNDIAASALSFTTS
jgi:hypothetical protein